MPSKYKKPFAEYAKQYEISLTSVKRYAAKGYHLDDPATLAKEIDRQKNRPTKYTGKYGPASAPAPTGKRGVHPRVVNVLIACQLGRTRINRWGRRLKVSFSDRKAQRGAGALELIDFSMAMIGREISCMIFDAARAASGVSLEEIREERRKQEAKFWNQAEPEDE